MNPQYILIVSYTNKQTNLTTLTQYILIKRFPLEYNIVVWGVVKVIALQIKKSAMLILYFQYQGWRPSWP